MDRRVVLAIVLMMVIAIAPAIFFKPPAPRGAAGPRPGPTPSAGPAAPPSAAPAPAPAPGAAPGPAAQPAAPPAAPDTARLAPAETVLVSSPLYTYGFSTRGARWVRATLHRYRSMAPDQRGRPAELVPRGHGFLSLALIRERDTVAMGDWPFTPSARSLTAPAELKLSAARGAVAVDLDYRFTAGDYRVDVAGRVSGVGPNGGLLLIELPPGLANTEADSNENHRALAIVTKQREAERTDFGSLEPGKPKILSGPFEWVAVKSKYFVTAVFAVDSAGGRIGGVTATAPPTAGKHPSTASVWVTLPVDASGAFHFSIYAGPMEYDRLRRVGHGFDDVNPYGWPGIRTLIRFFAVPVRWLLVFMHERLGLAYGVGLIVFGILVRILLWPLNQKAMRASMQMQAVQPLIKEIQERYRNDPQRLQQEMFRLYKEHNVNPFGGCWPMLLPMPILFALFFVFQNTIELRGTSFLWIPDLSRPDPLYIIPLIMGLSMFALSKVGQMGMEPNPQMKMMLYVMPVMMTFLFLNFASGLNLYYAVSNIASIPQQYLLARERMRRAPLRPPPAPAPEPRPAPAERRPRRRRK